MKFECGYIYPRVEELEVRAAARSGKVLVVGLKGSGVSTLLDRISRLSGEKYDVRDVGSLREALELYESTSKNQIIGATGSLRELLELLSKPPKGLNIVVLKPLTLGELEEYLSQVGVSITRRELLRELYFRSGGMPGEVCRVIVERGLVGRALTEDDVNHLPPEPTWIMEARRDFGSDFEKLMIHSLLAVIPRELASTAQVEGAWWLIDTGVDYRMHPETLWLQGFSLRLVDKSKAVKLLEEALRVDKDDLARYTHALALYKLTGSEQAARAGVESALRLLDGLDDLRAKYSLALSALDLAETWGPPEAYVKLVRVVVETAPLPLTVRAKDLLGMLLRAKRRLTGEEALRGYISILEALALRLAPQRSIQELDLVLAELEDIALRLETPANVRRYAERVYAKTLALKSAALGQWRDVLRVSSEALERGDYDSQVVSLLATSLCFTGLGTEIASKALKLLELKAGDDRRFTETLLRFCSAETIEEMRVLAEVKPEEEPDPRLQVIRLLARAATRTSIAEGDIERIAPPGPPRALIKGLLLAYKGESRELVNLIREVPEADDPSHPMSLVVDILLNVGSVIRRSSEMKRLAPHIALLADSLRAGRQEELGRIVGSIASRLRDGDAEGVRIALAKLVFYALNTFY